MNIDVERKNNEMVQDYICINLRNEYFSTSKAVCCFHIVKFLMIIVLIMFVRIKLPTRSNIFHIVWTLLSF